MELILTRSPYSISRGELDSNASLAVDIGQYNNGTFIVYNSYTLVYRNQTHIDISNLINSEIGSRFTYNGSTGNYEDSSVDYSNGVFVSTTLSGAIDGVTQSDVNKNFYATDGYVYSFEDLGLDYSNILKNNGYYAGSSDSIYKHYNTSLKVPLLNSINSSYLGRNELMDNGEFPNADNWTLVSGDTVSGGKLNINGATGSRKPISLDTVDGEDYYLTFELSNVSSGSLYVFSYGNQILGNITSDGTYSASYTQTAGSGDKFTLYTSNGFVGDVDNITLSKRSDVEYAIIKEYKNGVVQNTDNVYFNSPEACYETSNDDIDSIIITTDHTTKTLNVETVSECKFNPYRITFDNRYGQEESLWFFKKSVSSISVSSEDFRANQFQSRSYGSLARSNQEYNKNGKESLTLNSGFVSEEVNESFKQLMLSERVVLRDSQSGKDYSVKIKESQLLFKTSLNNKLINYRISVEFSNNIIDNIF